MRTNGRRVLGVLDAAARAVFWISSALVTACSAAHDAPVARETRTLTTLGDDLEPLRAAFDARSDRWRVIALVSPTCSECLLGAEGVEHEITARFDAARLGAFVVWIPMLEGDDVEAARSSSVMFPRDRAQQFYDARRSFGRAYATGTFAGFVDRARRSIPADHPLAGMFADRSDDERPQWDLYMLYAPNVRWQSGPPPMPSHWIRHVGRRDGVNSTWWRDTPESGPQSGDLHAALRAMASAAMEPDLIPAGKSRLELDLDGTRLEVFTYKPERWSGERMILVHHGVLRNADEYRDHAIVLGDRFDALIVSPRFDAERFPNARYQRGGIVKSDGTAAEPKDWTYAFVPKIAAAIRTRENKPKLKHWIIGHSAGGQFAMRMSAFQDTGAERIVAANPGTDLFPTRDVPFGWGFGKLPDALSSDAQLKRYLAAPLTLYLGTADDHKDEDLDMSAESMKQGEGRLQRGRAAFALGQKVAAEHNWPFAWRLVEAEGVPHDHEKMFAHPKCEEALFGIDAHGRNESSVRR